MIGLLLTLALALGVMALFALPQLRTGSRILTPDGERVVERAKRQATTRPVEAAGSTWQGLIRVRAAIAAAWAPISTALHDLLDRLETRDGSQAEAPTPEAGSAEPDEQLEHQGLVARHAR